MEVFSVEAVLLRSVASLNAVAETRAAEMCKRRKKTKSICTFQQLGSASEGRQIRSCKYT